MPGFHACGVIIAVLVTAGIGVLAAKGTASPSCSSQTGSGQQGPVQHGAACGQPVYPLVPGGEPVQDAFYFVRQPLAGNGVWTQWNYTGETPACPAPYRRRARAGSGSPVTATQSPATTRPMARTGRE